MNASHTTDRCDFKQLVTLLPTLRRLVDAGGVVMLEPDEAERIRALGFQARSGPWRVPPIPAGLVTGNPILEHLGDTVDPFWLPSESQSNPRPAIEIVEQEHGEHPVAVGGTGLDSATLTRQSDPRNPNVLTDECAAILAAIDRTSGTIERRKLQKKLWRIPATRFNQSLQSLIAAGILELDGKMVKALANQGCSTSR